MLGIDMFWQQDTSLPEQQALDLATCTRGLHVQNGHSLRTPTRLTKPAHTQSHLCLQAEEETPDPSTGHSFERQSMNAAVSLTQRSKAGRLVPGAVSELLAAPRQRWSVNWKSRFTATK
ncbi:hypothetical protein AOLI_G00084070 [Acnodon oligacanthus]